MKINSTVLGMSDYHFEGEDIKDFLKTPFMNTRLHEFVDHEGIDMVAVSESEDEFNIVSYEVALIVKSVSTEVVKKADLYAKMEEEERLRAEVMKVEEPVTPAPPANDPAPVESEKVVEPVEDETVVEPGEDETVESDQTDATVEDKTEKPVESDTAEATETIVNSSDSDEKDKE